MRKPTPKTVRLLGNSNNLSEMPETPRGVEMWACNDYKKYGGSSVRVMSEYTRWFNLHSRVWMTTRYPKSFEWHLRQDGGKTFYTQVRWRDIPGSVTFPRRTLQKAFATPHGPNRYFTCTLAWQMALAIYEQFQRIECWGFELGDKPGERYAHQRPCFFYWVEQARARGITVTYQPVIDALPIVVGDPDTYDGPLYGYETKPEGLTANELRKLDVELGFV